MLWRKGCADGRKIDDQQDQGIAYRGRVAEIAVNGSGAAFGRPQDFLVYAAPEQNGASLWGRPERAALVAMPTTCR